MAISVAALPMIIAALIFTATYLIIALGRLPGLRLDRTGAALLGASLMVASGTLSLATRRSAPSTWRPWRCCWA